MTNRFRTLFGNDIKSEAVAAFEHNHEAIDGTKPVALVEPIENLTAPDIRAILLSATGERGHELDCLVGGPPCEGFSQNRTIRGEGKRTHKFIDDPRNSLFKWFVDLAAQLQPKVVVMENVPDLVRHRNGETRNEIIQALEAAGYKATVRVLNAADYGVPQMRRRAFFLCQRKSDYDALKIPLEFPVPTHKPYPLQNAGLLQNKEWLPGDAGYWVTVWEALGDLPPAGISDDFDHANGAYPKVSMTTFRALMRSSHGAPYNHIARKLGKGGLKRLVALTSGQTCSELPDDLRPNGFYHYSYTRASWSEPARTITKFVYHVGSGQFGHPDENRAFTIREAARLQSFPDSFRFLGTSEIRKLSALVGSAVPPLLARALGRQISQYLDQLQLARLSPANRKSVRAVNGDAVMRRLERQEWGTDIQVPERQATLL